MRSKQKTTTQSSICRSRPTNRGVSLAKKRRQPALNLKTQTSKKKLHRPEVQEKEIQLYGNASGSGNEETIPRQILLSSGFPERMLTVKEAAYRLNVSADAVYLWLRTGRLQGWQPGGCRCSIQILESSVEAARKRPVGTQEYNKKQAGPQTAPLAARAAAAGG